MPFVVLFDEESDLMLVATYKTGDGPVSVVADGIENAEMTFRSVEHWQRDFQRCWRIDTEWEYEITWDTGKVLLRVDDVGSIVRLAHHPSPPSAPIAEPVVPSVD